MGLNTLDLGVIALYLAGVTLFGLRFRSRSRTLKGYFLADKSIPWWAISLSIVAAETSTLTIISVPGLAYDKDFRFLQLVLGYLLGRIVVSFLFIPQYFRGELVTAYELIRRRFGKRLHLLVAGIFLATRAAAEGVRVFAVAIVIRAALGTLLNGFSDLSRDLCAIGIVTLLTLAYTFEGGLSAVIWTDVVQLAIYIAGTLTAVFTLLHLVPGGWPAIHSIASASDKFRLFDLSFNLTDTYTLWSGLIGGAFLTCASHGTDQLIVQRLLAARSQRQSQAALLSSGLIIFVQFSLFLLIGAMLYAFYRLNPPASPITRTDTLFPTFIVTRMPHLVAGLLIAAILAAAMSNLSAALNALSSTTIIDFYSRLRPQSTEARRIQLSRISTIFWALALFALAILSRNGGKVIENGLAIASIAYGGLLGVFLLGVLTRRASESGAILGFLLGFAVNLYLRFGTPVAFPWYVPIGSIVTFITGYSASFILPIKPAPVSSEATPCSN